MATHVSHRQVAGFVQSEIQAVDVDKPFILQVSLVASLGGLLFGFDTAIISGTIPYITSYFNLNEYLLGWAVSSILIGCGAGALLAGKLAETYGRRYVLIICAILFAVSGVGAALSNSLVVFVLYRLIGGLGVGAAAMVSPMYIAEIAPAHWRGRLVALYQLAIVFGILLAYVSNFVLDDIDQNNWRWMFGSQVVPAALFGFTLLFVPETPRWLVKKGRLIEARRILQKTVGDGFSQHEIETIRKSFGLDVRSELAVLLSRRYRPIVWLGIFVAIFQQVTGINSILYYAPIIIKQTGINTADSLLQTIGIGVVNVLSTFVAIGLVDRVGRKRLLLVGSVLMGLSLTTIALCFQYMYFDNYLLLTAMLVYVGAFGASLGAVTWVFLAEIFPNRIRGLALSAATLMLWLTDFIVTYTFPIMISHLGTPATLLTYAVFCAIAFLYFLINLPETKGKSLEEIEHLLAPNPSIS